MKAVQTSRAWVYVYHGAEPIELVISLSGRKGLISVVTINSRQNQAFLWLLVFPHRKATSFGIEVHHLKWAVLDNQYGLGQNYTEKSIKLVQARASH